MRIWQHLRHSRGYGVHSPMLYRIVRKAMMPRKVMGADRTLFNELLAQGIGRRNATRLQNLYTIEHYSEWSIDASAGVGGLTILTPNCEESVVRKIAEGLIEKEGVVVVLRRITDCKRRTLCKELVMKHHSMSAESPTMLLLFARSDLRKQHIII